MAHFTWMFRRPRKRATPSAAVAVIGVIVTAVTACSSSGGNQSLAAAPKNSVIEIGSEMPLTGQLLVVPQLEAGINAAVSSINAQGGLDGHPLKLVFCDTAYDPNQELSCMRTLISDKVNAIVAPLIVADTSGREYQLAQAANIPIVGSLGLTQVEYNAQSTFPLVGGIPSWVYGAVEHLIANGAKKIAYLGETTPASELIGQLVKAADKSAGITTTQVVNTDDTTSDPTFAIGAAKAIAGNPDGIVVTTNPQFVPKAVLALRHAGYTGSISTISSILSPAVIKALGSAGNGLLVTSDVALVSDTTNPAVAEFLTAMKKYQPSASLEELTIDGWAAVQLLAKVAPGDVTAAEIMKSFENLKGTVGIGVMGPFAQPAKPPYLGDFPNIYNATVENGVLKDAVIVSDGKGFVNPFTALADYVTK
jgi:branched-chain amino acid transport system substrate-binding protein